MREKWTDERLDDMSERMGEGFRHGNLEIRDLRAEIHGLRSDMTTEFAAVRTEIHGLRSDMTTEFAAVRAEMSSRFDAMQRLIIQVGGGMFVTMIVGFLGVITQL